MDVDIENIASTRKPFWRSIYEVIDDSYCEVAKLFPKNVLNQCRNNQNEPQNIPNEIKADFKNVYGVGVVCTSGYDPLEEVR